MKNLREQLIRAGLIKPASSQPESTPSAPVFIAARTIPPLPPLALPGSKIHQRLEALKQQELNKRLLALVVENQVPLLEGTHPFHFVTRKGKLRRLDLSESQAKDLEEGKLAVVERHDPAQIEHGLVPGDIADKLLLLSDKAVRFYNREGKPIGFSTAE